MEQQHGIIWNHVAYFLKRLSDTESKYTATEREMLDSILAIESFHPYLVGGVFDTLSDHAPN